MSNYDEWKRICKAWCKKNKTKLLFVTEDSFGCETENGALKHIYYDELIELLKEKKEV